MKSPTQKPKVPVKLNRNSPPVSLEPFTQYFQGFERVEAVRKVFGEDTEEVLKNLRIGFIPNRGMYMGIRDNDGNIAVGTYHLRTSPTRTLYLDIVHELFHIKQRMKDGEYFHDEFMKFLEDRTLYYASPIEIPAYEHTVREAERIGMSKEEIVEYLKIGDAPPKVWKNFLKEMKLSNGAPQKKVTRFPVKIRRKTSPKLHAFSDYFQDFQKSPSIRELLGDSTEEVLGGIKVEFIDSPFPSIYPNEDDGHLVVASEYFRKGSVSSIYLDAFLSLNLLKQPPGSDSASSSRDSIWESPEMLKAYSAMVYEAKRLGVPDEEIMEHLTLPSFMMSPSGYRKFLKALGLKSG